MRKPPAPRDTWSTRVSSHSPPVFCASPGSLPALRTNQNGTLSRPSDIIIHLRKQVTASVPACIGAEILTWCWSCDQLRRIDRLIGVAHQSLVQLLMRSRSELCVSCDSELNTTTTPPTGYLSAVLLVS